MCNANSGARGLGRLLTSLVKVLLWRRAHQDWAQHFNMFTFFFTYFFYIFLHFLQCKTRPTFDLVVKVLLWLYRADQDWAQHFGSGPQLVIPPPPCTHSIPIFQCVLRTQLAPRADDFHSFFIFLLTDHQFSPSLDPH